MPQPLIKFTPYITERMQYFVGREWVFNEINTWASSSVAASCSSPAAQA